MGNKKSLITRWTIESAKPEPVICHPDQPLSEPPNFKYKDADNFIPLFRGRTSILLHGYVRTASENCANLIPIDIIDIIHHYSKQSNSRFILIFEHDTDPNHSYLHGLDIELSENKRLYPVAQPALDVTWKEAPGASYCYGQFKSDENVIYRVGGDQESIVYIPRIQQAVQLPQHNTKYTQSLYIKNHGLFVFGGQSLNGVTADRSVYNFDEGLSWNWFTGVIPSMKSPRMHHLALEYKSNDYTISDKIFCIGGRARAHLPPLSTMEVFDFNENRWSLMELRAVGPYDGGGCIDYQTNTMVIGGSTPPCRNRVVIDNDTKVREYDLTKMEWIDRGTTNYPHRYYPSFAKNNGVIVVFGDQTHLKRGEGKMYSYVEYYDTRASERRWLVLSSLRELLGFTGEDVKNRIYHHAIQL